MLMMAKSIRQVSGLNLLGLKFIAIRLDARVTYEKSALTRVRYEKYAIMFSDVVKYGFLKFLVIRLAIITSIYTYI